MPDPAANTSTRGCWGASTQVGRTQGNRDRTTQRRWPGDNADGAVPRRRPAPPSVLAELERVDAAHHHMLEAEEALQVEMDVFVELQPT